MEYSEEAIFMSVDLVQVDHPHHLILPSVSCKINEKARACSVGVTFTKRHMLNSSINPLSLKYTRLIPD